jgi:hypothetical protein
MPYLTFMLCMLHDRLAHQGTALLRILLSHCHRTRIYCLSLYTPIIALMPKSGRLLDCWVEESHRTVLAEPQTNDLSVVTQLEGAASPLIKGNCEHPYILLAIGTIHRYPSHSRL